jgi:hypothetical protein
LGFLFIVAIADARNNEPEILLVVFQFYLDAMLETLDMPALRYDEGKFVLVWALKGTIFDHSKRSQIFRDSNTKIKMESVQKQH